MDSLFAISNDLRRTLEDIEIQGGEISDEQAETLEIREADLKTKLSNYRKAIKIYESQSDICSDEIKRLQAAKKTRVNIVDRLKYSCLKAVNEFGDIGKSGNRVINLDDCKFYTSNTKVLNVDENKVHILAEVFIEWANNLNDIDCLISDFDDTDFNANNIINSLNKICHTRNLISEEEYFTVDDLYAVNIEFSAKVSLAELLKRDKVDILKLSLDNTETIEAKVSYDKAVIKGMIDSDILENCTVAKIDIQPKLNIR